ncbi:Uncharacterised protein [Legionella pneumophila]|nr:Uncharacterised protein [Legionella pneumophila]
MCFYLRGAIIRSFEMLIGEVFQNLKWGRWLIQNPLLHPFYYDWSLKQAHWDQHNLLIL